MMFLDLKSAAEYIKISADALRDLADAGLIPAAKISRAWVFRQADLDAYITDEVMKQTEARRSAFMAGRRDAVPTAITEAKKRLRQKPALPAFQVAHGIEV